MTDGQLLVTVDRLTHATYMHETNDAYRVVVGNQTVVFSKENDPTLLTAPSTGKLIKFLIGDGDHVTAGTPYAEMEVMKMVTTLNVNESGVVQFCKRPGAVLENGSLIAKMSLDDPSQCQRVKLYDGPGFPSSSEEDCASAKSLTTSHQGYLNTQKAIENALDGYCCPDEKRFKETMENTVTDFLNYLNNPRLPLDEMKEVLASVRGRIHPKLERTVIKLLAAYEQNITSVLAQFPSQKITAEILGHLATVNAKEKEMVELTLEPIMEVCSRYKAGVRGQMKRAVVHLINKYLSVEKMFQVGHYDKIVSTMWANHKDNIWFVVDTLFAHIQYRFRNIVITTLLDKLWTKEPRLTKDLKPTLRDLTNSLVKAENSTVSLKARTILIASEKPSYELRHNHIEKMFLDAINRTAVEGDDGGGGLHLERMITDESSVFDVLGDFFYHADPRVRAAALEVYVRRAFISYEVTSLNNLRLSGRGTAAVKFDFLLPQSHPNRSFHAAAANTHRRSDSDVSAQPEFALSPAGFHLDNFRRHGVMSAFETFEAFEADFESLVELFFEEEDEDAGDAFSSAVMAGTPGSYEDGSSFKRFFKYGGQSEDPMNIMNVAVKMSDAFKSDADISQLLGRFCRNNADLLKENGIRRITFTVVRPKEFPKYFTFRSRSQFEEDGIYRHLEPALAFQLELNRLKNYHLDPIQVANNKMHLYLGRAKVSEGREVSDYRFFIRSIIRHSDLLTSEASFDYLKNEGERLLLESLDELEVAFLSSKQKTDCNHIFLNFAPTVTMDPQHIAKDIEEKIILRYAGRFLKFKVKYAEIRMSVRWPPTQKVPSNLRLSISNDAGYLLNMYIYKEVTDPHTGVLKFITVGNVQGPMHGLPVSTPYMTRDFLETKRSKAMALETTFVYDFPDMFKMNLRDIWKEHECASKACFADHPKSDAEMFSCVELVLDSEEKRVLERKRYPGENDVAMVAWKISFKTPEYPQGRDVIVIANDITTHHGSFGVREDKLFLRASELARKLKVPRIYLSANSGARIAIAKEVLSLFKIAWEEPSDPEKGFKYIYLTPEDYSTLSSCGRESVVHTELIQVRIFIGLKNGLNFPNTSM